MANELGPFSVPLEYHPGVKHGFLVKPASEECPDGWGEPFRDEQGNRVPPPGTPGGAKPVKFIAKPTGEDWKCRLTPGDQVYGAIDWRGPKESSAPNKPGRRRLSFHGPTRRYFPDESFTYGVEDTHHDIYQSGKIAGVAPHPVLGAALQKQSSPEQWWLVAACYASGVENVYVRPYSGPVGPALSESERNALMALYHEKDNPAGWRLVYSSPITAANGAIKAPRTPWFFNESGTEAQCVREVEYTFNNNLEEVTEVSFTRFRLQVSYTGSANIVEMGNNPGYTVKWVIKKKGWGDQTTYGYTGNTWVGKHWWDVHSINGELTVSGRMYVAVDYDGDELILGSVYANCKRNLTRWLYYGVDNNHPGDHDGTPNTGSTTGLGSYYVGEVPYAGDGHTATWGSRNELLTLDWGDTTNQYWLFRGFDGTRTEFTTGKPDPEGKDVYAYFSAIWKHFVHCVDLRAEFLTTYFREEDVWYQDGRNLPWARTRAEYHNDTVIDRANGEEDEKWMEKTLPDAEAPVGDPFPTDDQWYDTTTMRTVFTDTDTTRVIITKNLTWPTITPATGEPPLHGWYSGEDAFERTQWPSLQAILIEGECTRVQGWGVDDYGNKVLSLKSTNAQGEEQTYNWLKDGDLPTVCGDGESFFPVGTV